MKFLNFLLAVLFLLRIGAAEESKIRVVTTLPDLRSIAEFVGGDLVTVEALSRGFQDPHYIDPKPSLMAAVSQADLFVEMGLDLELWSERVLDGARNAKVRVGNPGHVYASEGVARRELPQVISRAAGDLHPQGNPHIWLDPLNGKIIAANIAAGLKRVAPQHAADFDAHKKEFDLRIDEKLFGPELVKILGGDMLTRLARGGKLFDFLEQKEFRGEKLINKLGGWLGEAKAFRGQKIITFHKAWTYFADRFGIQIANTIEEKPGIPPSAKRKEDLIQQAKKENIRVIAVENFYDQSVGRAVAEATGARFIVIPIMTDGVAEAKDYLALFDHLVSTLRAAYSNGEVKP